MNKKKLFYLVFPTLFLISCRNESDVLGSLSKPTVEKAFSTFIFKDNAPVEYASGFKKLALRYDSIHNSNLYGLNTVYKDFQNSENNYVYFNLHSKPLYDSDGNVYVVYPKVTSNIVTGIVLAGVNINSTKVIIKNVSKDTDNSADYVHNLELFQKFFNQKSPVQNKEPTTLTSDPPKPSEAGTTDIEGVVIIGLPKGNTGAYKSPFTDDGGTITPDPNIGNCTAYGDCYVGSGGSNIPNQNLSDPCTSAKIPASRATAISKTQAFAIAKTTILQNGQVESGAYLMPGGNGQLVASSIVTGTATSVTVSTPSTAVAIVHDHLDGKPPSSGDVYGLIDSNKNNLNLVTSYLIDRNPDGTAGNIYALIVTDPVAAKNFVDLNPSVQATPTSTPNFPIKITDDFNELRMDFSEATVLSYILDKYNVGIALTQMTSAGNFKKINIVGNQNSDKTITLANVTCTN